MNDAEFIANLQRRYDELENDVVNMFNHILAIKNGEKSIYTKFENGYIRDVVEFYTELHVERKRDRKIKGLY